ncbi:hypothetical protein IAU60_001597 [Kwoniella sp. DSM 27419]
MSSSFKIEDIFGVKGKVVVITGGGTGIGKALTAGFATNGAKVYIIGRRKEILDAAAKDIGGDIVTIQGDVATKSGCKAIADAIGEKEQKVDVLVNCAGVIKQNRTVIQDHNDPDQVEKLLWEGQEEEDFDYSNSINVNGVYFTTAAFVPLLRKSDTARVIIIASIAGLAVQRALSSISYSTSKAAAIHLGRVLAGRLHPYRIPCNTICPGIFPSEMTGKSASSEGHEYNLGDGPSKAAKRSTIGRPGKPEEIVGPVLLLASSGGGYMTGAMLTVDGGRILGAGIYDGMRLPEDQYI